MQTSNHAKAELTSETGKDEWVKPEIISVTPITDTRGNGGVGFDFASEASN